MVKVNRCILFSESHCHVDRNDGEAIERARKAGVELVLTAGIELASSREAVLTAKEHGIVRACVGIHPWNADQYSEEALKRLRELATEREVVAVSEIGLDYVGRRDREGRFVSEYLDKQVQRNAFRGQLIMAKQLDLPVLVHDRTPDQEVLDIMEETGNAEVGAAIHGFSKDAAYARRCLEMGVYLSIGSRAFSGPGNESFIEAVKGIPLEYLLTETDSGNPEGVLAVAEKIAELKKVSREEVGRITTQNLRRLTGKDRLR